MPRKPKLVSPRDDAPDTASTESSDRDFAIPTTNTAIKTAESVGTSIGTGGTVVLKPHAYNVTLPPPDDYYFVREDQLDGLTKGSKSTAFEIALAAGGVALGLTPQALSFAGWLLWHQDTPFPMLNFGLSVIAVALGVLAVTKFVQHHGTQSEVVALKERIKTGQKVKVSNE